MDSSVNAEIREELPQIIQGGMGIGVSDWRLARAVAAEGQLGVVSGTALDTVFIRRLELGDTDGAMRRALAAFPRQEMVQPLIDQYFLEGGKPRKAPFSLKTMPTVEMSADLEALLIVACFVEVYLAKEGHTGPVGMNLLEKIQLPTLPSLFGAMLAGVDYILMGGGIPLSIPGALDRIASLREVSLKLNVEGARSDTPYFTRFDPQKYADLCPSGLKRPQFLAVISSDILAKTLVKKAGARVDGFVVEHHSAGGHNAPPRRGDAYGERDKCSLEKMAELNRPYWLAGRCASPESLKAARAQGAVGVQIGTAFACATESGILPSIKAEIIDCYLNGTLDVMTDFQASPTGYPFKRVDLSCTTAEEPCRVCDLGYLRHLYAKLDGSVGYRCPAGPIMPYLKKGGAQALTEGKQCLCNGLLATIGLGQIRNGRAVPPIVTWGEDMSFLDHLLSEGRSTYTAGDVIDLVMGRVGLLA